MKEFSSLYLKTKKKECSSLNILISLTLINDKSRDTRYTFFYCINALIISKHFFSKI